MKKIIQFISAIILILQTVPANALAHFEKIYSDTDSLHDYYYHDMILVSNGDIMVIGEAFGVNLNYVYRIDDQGNIVWTKSYGDSNSIFYLNNVCELTDHNFIITGSYLDVIFNQSYNAFIKINSSGDVLWSRKCLSNKTIKGIVADTNGGFTIVGGYSDSLITGTFGLIVKFDSSGAVLWSRKYGEHSWPINPYKIYHSNSGGYYFSGYRTDSLSGNWQLFTIKTDGLGNPLWSKYYGSDMWPASSVHTSDDGMIMYGADWFIRPIIIKIDSIGNTVFSYYLTVPGTSGHICGVFEVSPTELVAYGSYNGGKPFVERFLTNGTSLWKREYTPNNLNTGLSMGPGNLFMTSDGGFEFTTVWYISNFRLAIIKTDSVGLVGCNTETTPVNLVPASIAMPPSAFFGYDTVQINYSAAAILAALKIVTDSTICYSIPVISEENYFTDLITVIPNPFTDKLQVTTNSNQICEVIIYDIASRILVDKKFTNSITLNTQSLAKGMYIFEVRHNFAVIKKGKIIKQ